MEAPAYRPKLGRQRQPLPQPQQLLHRSSSNSSNNLSRHRTNWSELYMHMGCQLELRGSSHTLLLWVSVDPALPLQVGADQLALDVALQARLWDTSHLPFSSRAFLGRRRHH